MSAMDPLRRANILVHAGRIKEALETLQAAVEANPERQELKDRINEVRTENSALDLVVLAHLCMSWVFLWGPAFAIALLIRWGVGRPDSPLSVYGPSTSALVAGFLSVVALALATYYCSLHLWFIYLKHVVGRRLASVERRLPGFVWVDRLEPMYGRVRAKYLPSRDET